MIRYRVIDHPSDIGIEAFGKNKKELFENAAYGMMDIMFSLSDIKPLITDNFKVLGARDLESLLVSWLSEVLSVSDFRKMAFCDFNIIKMSDNSLEAKASGGRIGIVKTGIKAVTYSQMKIEETKGIWHTKIIFDV